MRAAFVGSEQAGAARTVIRWGYYTGFFLKLQGFWEYLWKSVVQARVWKRLLFNRTASPVTRMLQNRLAANRVGACHPPQRAFGAGEGKKVVLFR